MSSESRNMADGSELCIKNGSSYIEKPVISPSDVKFREPRKLAPLARIDSLYDDAEEHFLVTDKEKDSAVLNTVLTGFPVPAVEGNGGAGVLWTGDAADGRKDPAVSGGTRARPGATVPEQQTVPETRPLSRLFSGERRSRQLSGDRRSRHPSKEKEPVLPKSERLYSELMEAVANDSVPRTRSVVKRNSFPAEARLRGLHAAVRRGSNKAAKAILDVEPALVHSPDPNTGNTALLVAIEAETVSTMSLLVERGARLDAKNHSGETPWDVARRVTHENKGLVPTLVGLYKQHSKDYHTTPVHEAAAAGDVDKIDFLVEAGLDLWDLDRARYNFIHIAAFNNRANVILRYLRRDETPAEMTPSEADVDRRCKTNGKTALHVAANRGHLESFAALLKCGADIGALDNGRWTALHDAVVCRNEPAAASVIRAIYSNSPSLALSLTEDKETPLHVSARHGRLRAVQVLLELSAEGVGGALSMLDIDGWTPLHSAVESRRPEVVQLIIDAMNATPGVHSLLELPDRSGRSPLQLAQSLTDSDEVVNLLLSCQPGTTVNC